MQPKCSERATKSKVLLFPRKMKEKVMIVFWHNRRHAWFQCLIGIKLWLLDDLNHNMFHNWYILFCPQRCTTCNRRTVSRWWTKTIAAVFHCYMLSVFCFLSPSSKFTLNQFLALCLSHWFQIIFLLSISYDRWLSGSSPAKLFVFAYIWTLPITSRRMTIIKNECNVAKRKRATSIILKL